MQPITFEPLLKSTIWGGDKIIPFKHLSRRQAQVGESWEISGVPGHETVVKNGLFRGMTLNEVVSQEKGRLVGEDNYRRFGNEFPLLIKFIDAHADLSIQVHPNDEVAVRHGAPHGKTEMWFIMPSEQDAVVYSGLKDTLTPEQYRQMVAEDTITEAIAKYPAKEGDVFFLPAGRIHAIGAGCFLAEIQTTSDVTYRIYDYGRRDSEGKLRELHTEKAAESIDYHVETDYRTHYVTKRNRGVSLVHCQHFTTALYDLDEPMTLDYSELDSFVVLIALSGKGTLSTDDYEQPFAMGDTILLPATTEQVHINGTVKFLETYV